MVGLCYRCKEPGHKAMFCPHHSKPNEAYCDSGDQAWCELPYNTHRWKLLKTVLRQSLLDLEDDNLDKEDVVRNIMRKAFASGWRYCCWKQYQNIHSHDVVEYGALRTRTTATATTDSDSELDEETSEEGSAR